MEILRITHNTTEGDIQQFCNRNPGFCRKTVTAQARHERRVKRIQHRKQEQQHENLWNR